MIHSTEAERGSPISSRPRRWSPTRHVCGVAGVMLLTFAAHVVLMIQNWRQLRYRSFDSVIFDQAVRAYSRFQAPRVPLKGVYAGLGPDFVQLGDHFSPINALLAPLYWIYADVRVLFLAQAAMYAVAAAFVWRFTRRLLGAGVAYPVAVSFGVAWGLQSAMDAGYHELDCAVPLLAIAIERLYAGRHRHAFVAAVLLLLVKEEMGFVVAVLGLLFCFRGHRRLGAAVSFTGLAWSVLAIKVFVPAFGGNSQQYWSYGSLGPGPRSAATFALTHPWRLVELAVSSAEKQQLLLWLLAIALGACLLSPIALLALPSLALRLLSDTHTYTTVHWQYNGPLMVIVLMAGVEGVARLANRPAWRRTHPTGRHRVLSLRNSFVWAWSLGVLAVAVYSCTTPLFPFSRIADQQAWQQTPYQRAAFAAADQVPPNATVEADDCLGLLISSRTRHLVLVDLKAHGSQYVLLGAAPEIGWPYSSREQILTLKRDYLARGYEEIWRRDGVWLLRHR